MAISYPRAQEFTEVPVQVLRYLLGCEEINFLTTVLERSYKLYCNHVQCLCMGGITWRENAKSIGMWRGFLQDKTMEPEINKEIGSSLYTAGTDGQAEN